ncbi:MAG: chemotaxis protein CheW [Acidobacteriota bacterium]
MPRSFDDQYDLAAPPTAVRWDLGEEPIRRRPSQKVCAVRFGLRLLGVPERFVRGLREVSAVTPIPRAPAHVLGLAALDGAIVPLVDITRALGIGGSGLAAPWTALLVEAAGCTVLIAVEEVVAFEAAGEDALDPRDVRDGAEKPLAFTDGRAPVAGRPVPLLDLPALLRRLRPTP